MIKWIARYALARSVMTRRGAFHWANRKDWREIKLYEYLAK